MQASRRAMLAVFVGIVAAAGYAQDGPANLVPKSRPAPAFGLEEEHYVRIGATEFLPDGSDATYASVWNPPNSYSYRRYWTGTGYPHFLAWAHVPGGALLDFVMLEDCDNNPTYALTLNVYACSGVGECNSTPIATVATEDGCGGDQASVDPQTVDNYGSEYLLEVVFPASV